MTYCSTNAVNKHACDRGHSESYSQGDRPNPGYVKVGTAGKLVRAIIGLEDTESVGEAD